VEDLTLFCDYTETYIWHCGTKYNRYFPDNYPLPILVISREKELFYHEYTEKNYSKLLKTFSFISIKKMKLKKLLSDI
jgi:hypothetical protein